VISLGYDAQFVRLKRRAIHEGVDDRLTRLRLAFEAGPESQRRAPADRHSADVTVSLVGDNCAGAPGGSRVNHSPRADGWRGLDAAVQRVARGIEGLVPIADLSERDVDYIRAWLPVLSGITHLWFRPRVRGLHYIPRRGPVLLVGNHSGGNVVPDTIVFTLAFVSHFGPERPFYQLAHNLVLLMPHVRLLRLKKFGTIQASPGNAVKALRQGAAVLVYPGGDLETHRPSWQSARIDFAGRKGFIRLALRHDVPIVPVVSIGGQETALFLSRGQRLAHLLELDRTLRLRVLPVSLALPWGLNVGDMLGHIPLPAKISIDVLPPIRLRRRFGERPDLSQVYAHIITLMQRRLDRLADERRFPILG
jgi:1-acyl-sn-glycerol-3-phosphate acyltransferase